MGLRGGGGFCMLPDFQAKFFVAKACWKLQNSPCSLEAVWDTVDKFHFHIFKEGSSSAMLIVKGPYITNVNKVTKLRCCKIQIVTYLQKKLKLL